jgi:putative SOS response-associated peptidase YedK
MCGRYVSASSPSLLGEYFGVEQVRIDELEPSFNVAPRAEVPIVATSKGERVLDQVRWGLVPFWAKDASIGDRLINARAETITTKPTYRRAFERRRCIIPADGFYEWRNRQPHFIHRRDGAPLAFAGVWEAWYDPSQETPPRLRSCAIVTTTANDDLAPLHDRMPVVLPASVWSDWLDPERQDVDAFLPLLAPLPNGELVFHPVSKAVNKADNNGPELVEPVDPEPVAQALL